MAWEHLDVNKPHLVYIVLGGFTSLFMLCSSVIKERLYIGEATVATLCGIIFGPHAANLINPLSWGNTDQVTLEFSRIVLVVQCFAVGVELPKAYMERHWRSVTFLLIPVMTFGWLISSLFIWAMFNPILNWLDSLCIAACVTATDPVLASSVVGKGKFAKRVPKHLRDLLSAESGCNDGMAFPFIYLALYLIRYRPDANEVAFHWFCYTILYECVFGAVYGVAVGYIARRAIRYAHEKDLIDRESFLVFYFVLALFCAGSGSILGIDDLLVGFATGVGFSNDGWFTEKTEESHVSNVIDLLINLTFFVYFGTIIPWNQFNAVILQLNVWRFIVLAILILLFRRIPAMLVLKPLIPDIKTWREALFAGHFGPIGVGAIFVAILARGELETEYKTSTPLAVLPNSPFPHLNIIELIWPITCFLVLTSIVVHGSSIAVFTLGKHINTLTLTMSYTQANDQGPHWMDRLPRIQSRSRSSMSIQRTDSEYDEKERGRSSNGLLPPIGAPGTFLRRQKEEDNPSRAQSRASSRHRSRRSRKWDSGEGPGGPVSQSAIAPAPRHEFEEPWNRSDSDTLAAKSESPPDSEEAKKERKLAEHKPRPGPEPESGETEIPESGEVFEEGGKTVYEDEDGNVLAVMDSKDEHASEGQQAREEFERNEGRRLMRQHSAQNHRGVAIDQEELHHDPVDTVENELEKVGGKLEGKDGASEGKKAPERPAGKWRTGMNKMSTFNARRKEGAGKAKADEQAARPHGPARAYQYGNTIIVEDEDGEVIKKYDIPAAGKGESGPSDPGRSQRRLGHMGKMLGFGGKDAGGVAREAPSGESSKPIRPSAIRRETAQGQDDEDDARLRFTITTGGGRRMSKAEFINQIRQMDPKSRAAVVEESDAPEAIKREAREEAREFAGSHLDSNVPVVAARPEAEEREATGDGQRSSQPTLQPVKSHESGDLKLVDSNNEDIPVHDISSDLRRVSMRSPTGETAAERRRRQALQNPDPDDEDSEDDGTERVPPAPRGAGKSEQPSAQTGETAAERRRREGALGLRQGPDSDSDEEDESGEPAQRSGIRFADELPEQQHSQLRNTTLRWGRNVGR